MTMSLEIRQLVCVKRWKGKTWSTIHSEMEGTVSIPHMRKFWRQFLRTGSCELTKALRLARADRHLTDAETDWLAARILDGPDLLLKELRVVFVEFHPAKSWIGLYPITQALVVRSFLLATAVLGISSFSVVHSLADQESVAQVHYQGLQGSATSATPGVFGNDTTHSCRPHCVP